MKLTKQAIEGIMLAAVNERQKARTSHDRQQGVVNLCEWLLKNTEFEEAEKEKSDGGRNTCGPVSASKT